MVVIDLFSKRQKRQRGDVPDVYTYDTVPQPLRVQLLQIIQDGIGDNSPYGGAAVELYDLVHKCLCREYGRFVLHQHGSTSWERIANFVLQSVDVEQIFDVVEICLRLIDGEVRHNRVNKYFSASSTPDDAISEINERFRENGIGYEFASGEIIRVDSQLIHSEVVKPVLSFLAGRNFKGANDEFLKAHEHYRHGRYKECLTECLKAFESAMKSICAQKKWAFAANDTAKTLIDTCTTNGLFPNFMQSHIGNLRAILESGAPTLRNKLGAHGQGETVTTVTEATARFMLHTTATNILFFIESSQQK
jgi:hypothetical protein